MIAVNFALVYQSSCTVKSWNTSASFCQEIPYLLLLGAMAYAYHCVHYFMFSMSFVDPSFFGKQPWIYFCELLVLQVKAMVIVLLQTQAYEVHSIMTISGINSKDISVNSLLGLLLRT